MKAESKISLLLILVTAISFLAIGCKDDRPTLNVYNWGDYIDPEIIEEFEEEFNVEVNYSTLLPMKTCI